MRLYTRAAALMSLVFLVVLPILFLTASVSLQTVKMGMLALTAVWFVSASLWIGRTNTSGDKSNKWK